MITLVIGLIFTITTLVFIALQRLYSFVPKKELKRLSREGDTRARSIYKVAAYGAQGRLALWILATITGCLGLVLVIQSVTTVVAGVFLALFAVAVWLTLTSLRLSNMTIWLPVLLAKPLASLISLLHHPLSSVVHLVQRWRWNDLHTNLYDSHDLDLLLERQALQPDNRIHTEDLELLRRALHMRTMTAKQVLVTKKQTHIVSADDLIGPILLDALHRNGQHTYLVYQGEKENIIGTLRLSDAAAATEGGRVLDFVRPEIHTIKETTSLHNILDILRKTGHQLVVVVNEFEDFVGQVTIEGLMDYLFEHPVRAEIEVSVNTEEPEISSDATEVIE